VAFDGELADRVREVLADEDGVTERKMFGGLAFMVGGHMACGIVGEELMVRVGPRAYEAALAEPHVREMDFTGKPLRGMVYVGVDGIAAEDDLARWVERGHDYAASLPPKTA
jgi:TfoX/Sxy family transcriptional regulator of competence genes